MKRPLDIRSSWSEHGEGSGDKVVVDGEKRTNRTIHDHEWIGMKLPIFQRYIEDILSGQLYEIE